jgi:hypothetical protein
MGICIANIYLMSVAILQPRRKLLIEVRRSGDLQPRILYCGSFEGFD